ncbi:ATP-dependent 6-phosphofructokinase 5, chloroplastic-like, partial [Macadamia integrifolia]|uniref:ATP-dependent 6-phosphofructokinase 5, chloroplastic-like n=1 Tax=Macadamia integrifolia TaxID=60698 RepID=UPI001C4F242A
IVYRVHRAGPRGKIYFKPEDVKAAIVTCGGLCPGLNDVIRQIVITLEIYGVKKIIGIPFGYRGFFNEGIHEMQLSRKVVQNIHLAGGSLLGVSRGGPNVSDIVSNMEERGINMLFILGGNGTHAGANAIHNECRKRRMKVAVVGVPKTIDNDILLMDKTFGFDTAVEEAQRAINSAYIEAHSAYRGIGIVKLMGRSSGFIAMHASLASGQVDVCLIPEVPFRLNGPHGVLNHLKYLLESKGSAVVCVAEGAGQNFLEKTNATDPSGNIMLGDIGVHIQQESKKYFKEIGLPADVKYIDPTYMIRACRANAADGILCAVLGQNAVSTLLYTIFLIVNAKEMLKF